MARQRFERWLRRQWSFAIPRAYFLANIAAEDPVLHLLAQLEIDRRTMLDRQVANALVGIQHVRPGKGVGGTCIDTGRTRSAVECFKRIIPVQRLVDQNGGQEKVAADLLIDCLLYTSPSPRDATLSRMPSSA